VVPALPQGPPAGKSAPHRLRFMFIYGTLGAVLALAVVGVVIYAGRSINPPPAWSSWKPSGGGLGAAKQIAAHVGPTYRLPNGNQLVDPIPRGPDFSSGGKVIPIPFLALRGPKGKIDQVFQLSNDNTFTYSMCGLGQACSILTGKPSTERGTLVNREILEIALYTFKYVPSVRYIVAFMPPPAGSQPTYAVYLQKSDLAEQLKTPLSQTLSPRVPLPAAISPHEQQLVVGLTSPRTYEFGLLQTPQGDPVLVLKRPKA
jgi:hypothetical protein